MKPIGHFSIQIMMQHERTTSKSLFDALAKAMLV
jgi:hypothetical protein